MYNQRLFWLSNVVSLNPDISGPPMYCVPPQPDIPGQTKLQVLAQTRFSGSSKCLPIYNTEDKPGRCDHIIANSNVSFSLHMCQALHKNIVVRFSYWILYTTYSHYRFF